MASVGWMPVNILIRVPGGSWDARGSGGGWFLHRTGRTWNLRSTGRSYNLDNDCLLLACSHFICWICVSILFAVELIQRTTFQYNTCSVAKPALQIMRTSDVIKLSHMPISNHARKRRLRRYLETEQSHDTNNRLERRPP